MDIYYYLKTKFLSTIEMRKDDLIEQARKIVPPYLYLVNSILLIKISVGV